jgi:hypothetical protein
VLRDVCLQAAVAAANGTFSADDVKEVWLLQDGVLFVRYRRGASDALACGLECTTNSDAAAIMSCVSAAGIDVAAATACSADLTACQLACTGSAVSRVTKAAVHGQVTATLVFKVSSAMDISAVKSALDASVRCAISDRNLRSRMPLDPTHVRFNDIPLGSSPRLPVFAL